MPLDHSKATATISVTGLALSCYNPTTNNWEVGLLRQAPHVLRITVAKFADADNSSQATFEIDKQHKIYITAANAVVPDEPLYKRDPFSRTSPGTSDREDFRWIVDFDTEFPGYKPVSVERPDDLAITELYVASPVLYADKKDQLDQLTLVNLATDERTEFGTIAQKCHADITCNEGGAVILRVDGPLGFSLDLPHIDGVTHRILIENLCPEGKEGFISETGEKRSDFNHYYSIISLPRDVTFDLLTPEQLKGGEGTDAVCNPGTLGGRGRLFPV